VYVRDRQYLSSGSGGLQSFGLPCQVTISNSTFFNVGFASGAGEKVSMFTRNSFFLAVSTCLSGNHGGTVSIVNSLFSGGSQLTPYYMELTLKQCIFEGIKTVLMIVTGDCNVTVEDSIIRNSASSSGVLQFSTVGGTKTLTLLQNVSFINLTASSSDTSVIIGRFPVGGRLFFVSSLFLLNDANNPLFFQLSNRNASFVFDDCTFLGVESLYTPLFQLVHYSTFSTVVSFNNCSFANIWLNSATGMFSVISMNSFTMIDYSF
jgi:hypothetical protein